MLHHWFLSLIFFGLVFVFCDVSKLNGMAKTINENVQEKIKYFTSSSDSSSSTAQSPPLQLPTSSSKSPLADLTEASQTLKDINQTYKESKEKVIETKTSIKEGVRDVKESARSMARGLPRSEKEANQMLVAFGEKYFGDWKASFQRFGERIRQSRQGSSTTSAVSNKTGKVNASRQR